jgi:hypothetical protein
MGMIREVSERVFYAGILHAFTNIAGMGAAKNG